MEFSLLLLLAFLAGLLLLLFRGHPKAHGRLPPGPSPLPVLGNLLQMDRKGLLRSFLRLREKYGDVFTVYLGSRPVVVLCGTDAIREALVDQAEAFSGRGKIAVVDPIFQGYGVIFANGERWRALRRFSLATMRDFGMGKRSVEERIQEEARCLVEELRKSKGALLDNTLLFHSITSNIICSIVFGKRFDYKDPVFLRLLDLFFQSFSLISSFSSQVFELLSGILKHLPGPHARVDRIIQELKDFITKNIEKHRETLDPSCPQDFIDSFLLRMDKERFLPQSEFHHKNLVHTVLSLFFAGTESSSTTLRYGLLLFLKHPDVTEKVQAEIDRVIGPKRLPALEDRAKMPYTDAVIHEIQRYSDLTPIGVPHSVIKDTHFRGYHLVKENASVWVRAWPAPSSSSSSPRCCRTSPWAARKPQKTSTSRPRNKAADGAEGKSKRGWQCPESTVRWRQKRVCGQDQVPAAATNLKDQKVSHLHRVIQLPANPLGKWQRTPRFSGPCTTRETQKKLLAAGFILAQPWSLQSSGSEPVDGRPLSLSLFRSLSLSFSLSLSLCKSTFQINKANL
uniref:unspecific monooxygenase n=1 Tax=Oryctolagus cuniculus TaxID=9986 RepID=A0A5F9CU18_RABIT